MIPKLSAPLVKDIRTGEGVFEWLLALLGVVAGATGNLSVAHTGLYLTILAGIKAARRGLVKVVSLQQGAGIGSPIEPKLLSSATAVIGEAANVASTVADTVVPPSTEQVLSSIASAEQAAAQAQAQPGTPPDKVSTGLSPTPASSSTGSVTPTITPASS